MTTTNRASEFMRTAVLTSHVSTFFKRYRRAIQGWCRRERLRTTLHRLSDRELRDIGIGRSDIKYVEWLRGESHASEI
jgi:uncharacterized protein YjiS (DUF1127 family)